MDNTAKIHKICGEWEINCNCRKDFRTGQIITLTFEGHGTYTTTTTNLMAAYIKYQDYTTYQLQWTIYLLFEDANYIPYEMTNRADLIFLLATPEHSWHHFREFPGEKRVREVQEIIAYDFTHATLWDFGHNQGKYAPCSGYGCAGDNQATYALIPIEDIAKSATRRISFACSECAYHLKESASIEIIGLITNEMVNNI